EESQELLPVRGPTVGVPDAADLQLEPADLRRAEESIADRDDFDIRGGRSVADHLDVELPELPETARLGPTVAPHRPDREHLEGRGTGGDWRAYPRPRSWGSRSARWRP